MGASTWRTLEEAAEILTRIEKVSQSLPQD